MSDIQAVIGKKKEISDIRSEQGKEETGAGTIKVKEII